VAEIKFPQQALNTILGESARRAGDYPLLNAITVGGNLVALRNWSDLPVTSLVLKADLEFQGKAHRVLSTKDFFSQRPQDVIKRDEILTEISIPIPPETARGKFIKFTLTENDYSLLNLAVYIDEENNICKDARIAVSAITRLPQRLDIVEEFLKGKELSKGTIQEAVKQAINSVELIKSIRASIEYRREIFGIYLRRTLQGQV
ncbi:MAG: FAD binding domain-containing protein, partial [Promethearchaeota archaeon]